MNNVLFYSFKIGILISNLLIIYQLARLLTRLMRFPTVVKNLAN